LGGLAESRHKLKHQADVDLNWIATLSRSYNEAHASSSSDDVPLKRSIDAAIENDLIKENKIPDDSIENPEPSRCHDE
jgi:hypothetical protein